MFLARVSNTMFPLQRKVATLTKPSDSKALHSTVILTTRPGPAFMARWNAKSRHIFGSKRTSVGSNLTANSWLQASERADHENIMLNIFYRGVVMRGTIGPKKNSGGC